MDYVIGLEGGSAEWKDQLGEAIALVQVRDNKGLQQRESRRNAEKTQERHTVRRQNQQYVTRASHWRRRGSEEGGRQRDRDRERETHRDPSY